MSATVIFECVGGFFVPCLPDNADGTVREIDRVLYFDADDVARRCGADVASVIEGYGIFVNEAMTSHAPTARTALRTKYAYLSDEHFEEFLEQCKRLRFSPWGKHIWPSCRRNDRTGDEDLIVQLTADGFHAAAMRTGEVLSIVGPQWRGEDGEWSEVWLHDAPPAAARVGVMRRGMSEPLFMIAHWRDYAPWRTGPRGTKVVDEFWMKMPAFMIGKCAACLALRRAFAEYLDGVYGPEEMQQAGNPRVADSTPVDPVFVPDVAPETSQQFRLALINLGLGRVAHRDAVIDSFRLRFRPLYTQNIKGWYQAVVTEIRRNPSLYLEEELANEPA